MFPIFFFFQSDNINDIDHTPIEKLSLYIYIVNLRTRNVKLRESLNVPAR